MASRTEIANLALIQLGAGTITSFSDGTVQANLLDKIYDMILDEVLSTANWSTALRQATLSETVDAPTYRYANQFQLPTNPFCLKILEADNGISTDFEWERLGDKLVTDSATVNITYLARLTNTNDYGPHLQNALVHRLISALSYTLTGSQSSADRYYNLYLRVLDEMRAADATQGSTKLTTSTTITTDVR